MERDEATVARARQRAAALSAAIQPTMPFDQALKTAKSRGGSMATPVGERRWLPRPTMATNARNAITAENTKPTRRNRETIDVVAADTVYPRRVGRPE